MPYVSDNRGLSGAWRQALTGNQNRFLLLTRAAQAVYGSFRDGHIFATLRESGISRKVSLLPADVMSVVKSYS